MAGLGPAIRDRIFVDPRAKPGDPRLKRPERELLQAENLASGGEGSVGIAAGVDPGPVERAEIGGKLPS